MAICYGKESGGRRHAHPNKPPFEEENKKWAMDKTNSKKKKKRKRNKTTKGIEDEGDWEESAVAS